VSVSGPYRLASGGRADRSKPLRFRFDGKVLDGYEGDTLASALMANGIRLIGRSFKYHRPRGVVTAGVEEPNGLVQMSVPHDEPNVRATTVSLMDGMCFESQNRWPNLRFDLGAINSALSPLFPAGFYYKTFMGGFGWNVYSRIIRQMAGLGRAPRTTPEHTYENRQHHCDLLVVGAGPAGLCAAKAAALAGLDVLLVDEGEYPGGQLGFEPVQIDSGDASGWVKSITDELDALPNVTRLAATSATGYYDQNFITLLERRPAQSWVYERVWKVRAGQVLLACGALERPLVFPNNDRPGVMLLHACAQYAKVYGVMPGRRAVIMTNNSSAYAMADELVRLGLDVAAVVDVRAVAQPMDTSVEVLAGHSIRNVIGRQTVSAVEVAPLHEAANTAVDARRIDCDLVLMSGGWNPLVSLASQTGSKPVYDPQLATFVPGEPVQKNISAGAARGEFDTAKCMADGLRAGSEAVSAVGKTAVAFDIPVVTASAAFEIEPAWALPGNSRDKAFVDFQNDVTAQDVGLAISENLVSVEHVKRYTTSGMGTDQGKLGNTNTIGIMAATLHAEPGDVGTTTYRPPSSPVAFGAITGTDVGELVVPSRRTPITDWIEAAGASMFEAGAAYRRPSYFPQAGEDALAAISREALVPRQGVGIYDGTPLGKFELQGADVVEFLERVYTNRWADLEIGQGRFGLMLREDGRLLDDGVTFRLAANRYWMFCGTGSADHTFMHLERLLTLEWPELDVHIVRVTSQWANLCICGPHARDVLLACGTNINIATDALPFMGLRIGQVGGFDVRLARVGYTGELSFELNVRASEGRALWDLLFEAGEPFGITPIGSEASMVMRCEKGFISAGYEGDGIVNPYDAGFGWVVDDTKPDFIGKRSLQRDRNVGGVRPSVVGLLPVAEDFVPPDGTPIVDGREPDGLPKVVGYVTQGVHSPSLGRSIALAVMDDGKARMGETMLLASAERSGAAKVVAPCFIDPTGKRMR
jgi:sarcosine oxidase, subunit alpha